MENVETNSGSPGRQSSWKEANTWETEGQKRRITRKEHQRLLKKLEMEGFMAQKRLWNLTRNKALQDRGVLPREEGDTIREYKAIMKRTA